MHGDGIARLGLARAGVGQGVFGFDFGRGGEEREEREEEGEEGGGEVHFFFLVDWVGLGREEGVFEVSDEDSCTVRLGGRAEGEMGRDGEMMVRG